MRQQTFRPTEHFDRLSLEGRKLPPPSLGSPTFVWHIGIWRKSDLPPPSGNLADGPNVDGFINRNRAFLAEISEFISGLQARGQIGYKKHDGAGPISPTPIILEGMESGGAGGEVRQFETFLEQSHTFTIWWRDADGPVGAHTPLAVTDPDIDKALRVVVQTQVYADYVSVSIYIDGAKRHSGKQIHTIDEGTLGSRREKFAKQLDLIRRTAHEEVLSGRVDDPSSSQATAEIRNNEDLRAAISYLFDGIWDEFQDDFEFELAKVGKEDFKHGVVFINHRGLLMSMRGLDTPADDKRDETIKQLVDMNNIVRFRPDHDGEQPPWVPSSRGSSATIGPVDKFDGDVNEPEVVLKSMWPALCHMESQADAVDWVGCGILENRAIFASTLGAKPIDLSALDAKVAGGTKSAAVTKFIVLSKGEPHRKQIGRFVERILSLETMRIFALKNLGSIQNAYFFIESITKQLDDVQKRWSRDRDDLERADGAWKDFAASSGGSNTEIKTMSEGNADYLRTKREEYFNKLSDLNARVETQLIHIGADLERMGPGGSGHLAHNIARAEFLIDRLYRMVETLEIGNLNGWINYRQFSQRSLGPTFDMITATGLRLSAAHERLKALTDIVQVSALIVQSAATRQNTSKLEEIGAVFIKMHRLSIWIAKSVWISWIVIIFITLLSVPRLLDFVWRVIQWIVG